MTNHNIKLLLFDIDGTLIRTAGAGKKAMERSFEKVYGTQDGLQGIQLMGRTDPSILNEALNNHNLRWEKKEVEQFKKYYFQFLKEEIELPRTGKRICVGVPSLLESLGYRSEFILALLTGNWRYSAFLKLRYFGIAKYFTIGAFADDSHKREDLVPLVLKRFKKDRGINIPNKNVYVIGDTPLDIQCAKPYGVRTIAVATGFHGVKELEKEEPDYVFQNFEHTDEVINILSNYC
jgi:phosphoglycolate phosphatase